MGEKRKPEIVLLLQIPSKNRKIKVEIFNGTLWNQSSKVFRLRVRGKWFDRKDGVEQKFFTRAQIRGLIDRAMFND
jgi:hypothetical protein